MLTIGQLASAAGVTVRAVRHYHQRGLLPEPERDHSGYRRYDAAAVVSLIRIRVLADAGVPLAQVDSMLAAGPEEFAEQVAQVDRRLREEIRERREHRDRVARLAAGESLALPEPVLVYLARARELGFDERLIEVERDGWIMLSAQVPEAVAAMMEIKLAMIEDPMMREFYALCGRLVRCDPDDPGLEDAADEISAMLGAMDARARREGMAAVVDSRLTVVGPELEALLDAAFIESVPAAAPLLRMLECRGWTGWTNIRRKHAAGAS